MGGLEKSTSSVVKPSAVLATGPRADTGPRAVTEPRVDIAAFVSDTAAGPEVPVPEGPKNVSVGVAESSGGPTNADAAAAAAAADAAGVAVVAVVVAVDIASESTKLPKSGTATGAGVVTGAVIDTGTGAVAPCSIPAAEPLL
jgi:hypothetical protein